MNKTGDFDNRTEIQWCPGCPNFSILKAFKEALIEMGKAPQEICLVSGIGQAAKLPHYLNCNFFNGLHGRAIPVATGIKTINPDLTTIVVTGDGDCYGEGGNHFIHAIRRNPDITVMVHNNEIYALTKGQASPTTPFGEKRKLQMKGVQSPPLNMPAIAITQGCGFVARSFAGDREHLKDIMIRAIRYKGLSCIDIIQPCITWVNHPVSWYKEQITKLDEDYDPGDRSQALEKVMEENSPFTIGVFYDAPPRRLFASSFRARVTKRPLISLGMQDKEDIKELLAGFKP